MIKIAILADIHSNAVALSTCYKKAQNLGAKEYIFLGDYVGDVAYPQETMRLLREISSAYPCTFIRGNKEDYWINHRKKTDGQWQNGEWKYGSTASGMLRYDYDNLTDADIDWFESLPISKVMKYDGMPAFTICHGSPFKANQSMREDYDYIDELAQQLETQMTICAHFHIQTQYERKGKMIVNPGSVGVALGVAGRAQFMMLVGENGHWSIELYTIPYDVEETIRKMDAASLNTIAPGWYKMTKHVLRTGRETYMRFLEKVVASYRDDTGITTLNGIPEEYWERALNSLPE